MNISVDHVYNLLPALYRERDEASGGALRQYLEVLTDELAVVADGIDQLYDDLFVETAAPWVLPYLADLIGLRGLPGAATSGLTPRAEVANTIAYRRRKGTAAVLEQVARDTTGWPARAVEYFELVATCQHVNHVRPRNHVTVSVRGASRLEWLGTAFERGNAPGQADLVHLPEMRRIATRHGRYDLPNVGIVLWRLQPYPVTDAPARPLAGRPAAPLPAGPPRRAGAAVHAARDGVRDHPSRRTGRRALADWAAAHGRRARLLLRPGPVGLASDSGRARPAVRGRGVRPARRAGRQRRLGARARARRAGAAGPRPGPGRLRGRPRRTADGVPITAASAPTSAGASTTGSTPSP